MVWMPPREGKGVRFFAVLAFGIFLLGAADVQGQRLVGVVIAVDPQTATILVHHEPFAGMPAMTMPFAVAPSAIGSLHPNDKVTAVVAGTGSPWSLRDVALVGKMRAARYVPPLEPGATIPEIVLTDQDGRPFSLRSLGGRIAVLAFIYTRCGDASMCPLVSAKFARLQRLIDPGSIRLVVVTLDPAFDTPAVLKRYGAAFGARPDRWSLATGSADAISELSQRMGIVSQPGEHGSIVHSEALVVLDPQSRLAERVDGNTWTSDQALGLAQGALRRSAKPWVRVRLLLSSGVAAICGGGASGITVAVAIGIFLGLSTAFGLLLFRSFQTSR